MKEKKEEKEKVLIPLIKVACQRCGDLIDFEKMNVVQRLMIQEAGGVCPSCIREILLGGENRGLW